MKTLLQSCKRVCHVLILSWAALLFAKQSVGQTATVTFDYTGNTTTACFTDVTYSGASGTLTVNTTGIPSTATITGISFTAHYGVGFLTTNIAFTLNGNNIGGFSNVSGACNAGTIASINTAFFTKVGPNILAYTTNGGVIPGVFNGIFTVTYTNCSNTRTSAAGTDAQSACIGTPINNITYAIVGATGATVSPLPAGVTAGYNSGTVTISGTPSATGTFNYTVTPTGGCTSTTATGSITVNALPTITGTLAVCAGSTTQLTGSGTAAVSNPWVSATPAVATVSNTGLVTGVAGGTSVITYTNNNGCIKTATVTVNALPVATVNGHTDVNCNGGADGTITVLATGGTGPYKYAASTDGINFNWITPVPASTNPYQVGSVPADGLIANQPYRIKVQDSKGCISK